MQIRRSMRFSQKLRDLADTFRRDVLQSVDEDDGTVLDDSWRTMKRSAGSAKGGPYLAVHMRRQDYLTSRPKDVPDLEWAAVQIRNLLQKFKLDKVFIASDGTERGKLYFLFASYFGTLQY